MAPSPALRHRVLMAVDDAIAAPRPPDRDDDVRIPVWAWAAAAVLGLVLAVPVVAGMEDLRSSAPALADRLRSAGLIDESPVATLAAPPRPAFGLAALYLAAEAVTWGTLVSIDHDVARQGRALRAEVATLMAASMPPASAPDDDAAPLLKMAFAAIQADSSLSSTTSPLSDPLAADVTAADVTALLGLGEMSDFGDAADYRMQRTVAALPAVMSRCFLWPADVAGFRRCMRPWHKLNADLVGSGSGPLPFSEVAKQVQRIEEEIEGNREGFVGPLLAPALGAAFTVQYRSQALHRRATVLVAATRFRIATGSLPESAAALVPDHLATVPLDPFTRDAPLLVKRTDDGGLMVYSVGPDDEDDGGPPPWGAERPQDDDVGLRLAAVHDR